MADRVELQVVLSGAKEAENSLESLEQIKKDLDGKKIRVNIDSSSARREASEIVHQTDAIGDAASRANERFEAVLHTIGAISAALSNVAGGVNAVNSFASGIFSAFESAGNMFSFNILDKAMDTAVSMLTQNVFNNLDRITSRYDIMSTFSQYMTMMGVTQADADNSLARINESILGLPIGLDEAAYRLRRYQMFMGDINQATDFTIGIQRAIMAGGASEQMRNQAYMQIERLLTTGELTNKRQWMSLLNGLGVSVQFIAEELGHADMSGKELAGALYTGKITADEFLGAITSLGKGTSVAAQRLDEALGIYKGTIESWASNIEFAFIRGGTNTLNALNRMLVVETDVSIVGYMEKFRDAVNQAYIDTQEWIDENPESFTINLDALTNLGDSLGRFNLGDIATEALQNTADFINAVASGLNNFDADKTESFIAFAISIATPLATIAKNAGNLGFAMGVVERFEGHDWENLFNELSTRINRIADITAGLLNMIPDGLMDKLLAFGLTDGIVLYTALTWASKGFENLKNVISWFHDNGGWATLFQLSAWITLVAGAIAYYNQVKQQMDTKYNFDELNQAVDDAQAVRNHIHDVYDEFNQQLSEIDSQTAKAEELLKKINDLDNAVAAGDKSAISQLSTVVEQFNRLFPEMALTIEASTGKLDANSKAIAENAEAYAQAMARIRTINAYQDYLTDLSKAQIELNGQISILEEALKQAQEASKQQWLDEHYTIQTNPLLQFINALLPGWDLLHFGSGFTEAEVDKIFQALEKAKEEGKLLEDEYKTAETALNTLLTTTDEASEATNQLAEAQANASSVTQVVTNAFQAQAEALDALITKYEEYKTAAYDALHSMVSSFEEIQTKKDYDFESVLMTNAKKMAGYNQATQIMSDTLAAAMMNGEDTSLLTTYFNDLLSSGNYDAVIQAGERIASGLLQHDLELYGQTLAEIEPASLNQALVRSASEDWQNTMVGILSGSIPVFGEAWTQYLEQYNMDLNDLISQYGFNPDEGTFMNVANLADFEAAQEALEEFTTKYFGTGEDSEDGTATAAFQYLNELMNSMKEDSLPELGDAYTNLGTLIDEFTGERLVPLVQEHSNAKTEADNQKQATETLANLLQERGGDFTTFADQLNNVASAAGEAASQLQAVAAAVGAIPQMPSLTGALDNNLGAAFGDAVYRASGGPIGGTYRGYDSIPAMLTPGEFVIRRKAAQMLGRGFLDSINSLNIPAAVDSLMHSVNLPQSRIVAYDNRRTYDNHAQVIQNINTNNAAFTYRRASRFVGAL